MSAIIEARGVKKHFPSGGDEVIEVVQGHTVLAPPGVIHGFTNSSESPARLMTAFPTSKRDITFVE